MMSSENAMDRSARRGEGRCCPTPYPQEVGRVPNIIYGVRNPAPSLTVTLSPSKGGASKQRTILRQAQHDIRVCRVSLSSTKGGFIRNPTLYLGDCLDSD